MPQKMALTAIVCVLVLNPRAMLYYVSSKGTCRICVLQLASVHKLERGGLGSACT